MTGPDRQSCRRREFLGRAGGVAAGLALATTPGAATTPATVTVMTRNLYLGVDLSVLSGAESLADVGRTAARLLGDVDPARFAARADAIAAEIEATAPDVVALQEAALVRTRRPGDSGTASGGARTVLDVLGRLRAALAARGLAYDVAAAGVSTDVELPADTAGGPTDLRLTDRDVLLVRSDVEVRGTRTDTYDAALRVPVPDTDRELAVRRGYCLAGLTVGDAPLRAVSTHLASASPVVRRRQAAQLLDALPAEGPVVVCGDFNSGPGTTTGTYDLLTGRYGDAHTALLPEGGGFTCCQAPDLDNDRSRLDERVDAVLYRGDLRPTAVGRVGHRPADRVTLQRGDRTVRLWPSDHAGVVATFEVGAATPAGANGGTPDATPEAITPGGSGPGPGPLATLAALGVLAWLGRSRQGRREGESSN
jgi:endonuclease/exonuclease/phosphatase family metal-dependent hydrolase